MCEPALKARLSQRLRSAERESHLQRWRLDFHEPWGVAPGSRLNAAPLALGTNVNAMFLPCSLLCSQVADRGLHAFGDLRPAGAVVRR